jgi:hypothetical protein
MTTTTTTTAKSGGIVTRAADEVFLRDASESPRAAIRWHWPGRNPRISRCGRAVLISDDPERPASIPEHERCRLIGCRELWEAS